MGAWGVDSWGNDTALDWLEEFEKDAASSVQQVLQEAMSCESQLLTDTCCRGLAAAEVLAASFQMPGKGLPDVVRDWAAAHPRSISRSLLATAIAVVATVDRNSELQELWDANGRNEDWHASNDDLLGRLRSIESLWDQER